MSLNKKQIREIFRNAVFERAKYKCQGPGCNFISNAKSAQKELDAHHITPRVRFPNCGYVKENGIALCEPCHMRAEETLFASYFSSILDDNEFHYLNLYKIIHSNFDQALKADQKLSLVR